jgi:hypothetical protein
MTQIDWDCPVCKQPNSALDSACISCNCAFDAKPNEILQQKTDYDLSEAENVSQAAIKASDSNVEVPLIPPTKYMGIFPSAPTVQVSLIIFACCYFVVLIVAIPLALKFKPNILSSIASGAIVTAAISVVNYWKRSNMLISLRATKWTLILGSLVIILFADMIASILSIKMNNLQYFTSIIVQKIGQVFLLWMAYGTNAFTGVKKVLQR